MLWPWSARAKRQARWAAMPDRVRLIEEPKMKIQLVWEPGYEPPSDLPPDTYEVDLERVFTDESTGDLVQVIRYVGKAKGWS